MSNSPNGQWQQGGMDPNAYGGGQGGNQQNMMAMMMGQQQQPQGDGEGQDGSAEGGAGMAQQGMMSPMQGFGSPMQGMGFGMGMGGFMDPQMMMQMQFQQQMQMQQMNAMNSMNMNMGAGEAAESSAAALMGQQQNNMMNPAFFQMLQNQAAFQNPFMAGMGNGQQFPGFAGGAGMTAAAYLNMAQGGAMGVAADMPQSGGRDPGAVLNPFARNDKKQKQRKPKNKPKRPLSAYNIFFKDERENILKEIPEGSKKIKTEDGGDETKKQEEGDDSKVKKEEKAAGSEVKKEEGTEADTKPEGEKGDKKESGDGNEDDDKSGKKRKRVPHGKIGFESLAKIIGRRWKELPPERLEVYKKHAEEDMQRYRKEMEVYLQKQREGLEQSRETTDGTPGDSAKMPPAADGGNAGEE